MTPSRGDLGGHWPLLLALSVLVVVVASILALALTADSDPSSVSVADLPSVEASDEENRNAESGGQAQMDDSPAGAEPAEVATADRTAADEQDDPAAEVDPPDSTQSAPIDEPESATNADVEELNDAATGAETALDGDSRSDVPSIEPELRVDPAQIRQGETVLVRLSSVDAGAAWLTVDGATTVMVDEAGVWVGFVPVQPLSELGAYTVIVDLFHDGGAYVDTVLGEFNVVDAGVPIESITLIPGDEGLLAPELVAQDNTVRFVDHTGISGPRAWSGPWLAPLEGPDTGIFGALRSYNGAPASDWHHGHDIGADAGASISAPAAGMVVFAGELPVHGQGVILDHGSGVFSGYWHMSAIAADLGALVGAGDLLGAVGATGLAVGPHLHWEVIVHGRDVDPAQWLSVAFHE